MMVGDKTCEPNFWGERPLAGSMMSREYVGISPTRRDRKLTQRSGAAWSHAGFPTPDLVPQRGAQRLTPSSTGRGRPSALDRLGCEVRRSRQMLPCYGTRWCLRVVVQSERAGCKRYELRRNLASETGPLMPNHLPLVLPRLQRQETVQSSFILTLAALKLAIQPSWSSHPRAASTTTELSIPDPVAIWAADSTRFASLPTAAVSLLPVLPFFFFFF